MSQDQAVRRLKIIEGHLKRVRRMVEEGRYCMDILQQSLAVRRALKKVEDLILAEHLRQCVQEAQGKKREEKLREILDLFVKSR